MAGINGPNIVTDNLLAYIDAANSNSYSGSGLTCYDISGNGHTAVLTAGGNVKHRPNTNKGCFTFNTQNFTASGSAQLSTSTQKIGSASLSLGSTTGKATSIDTIDFDVDEWTIEFWFNPNTLSGSQNIFDTRTSSEHNGPVVYFNGVYLRYYSSGIRISFDTTGIVSTGNWYHIALTKNSSGVHTLWLDGTSRGTWTSSTSYSTPDYVTLGLYPGNNGGQTNGYVDELRVSNTARYTSSFTPSTSTFSIDEYTILLSHFNGADTSTTLDAIDGYFEHTDVLDMGTSDITINCWLNSSSVRGSHTYFHSKSKAANVANRYAVGLQNNTNKFRSFFAPVVNVDIVTVGSTELQTDQWYMVTAVFDRSDDMILYVNGVEETTTTYINNVATSSGISSYSSNNIQSDYPYRIGSYTSSDNVGLYPNTSFVGDIAVFMHYNRALSQSEIEQNFNAHRGRFNI